jgi:adenine-specific DNA-methyltransferase
MSSRGTPRQRLGQVATPPALADAMAAWVLAGRPRALLEPGAGGFAFSRAALRRAPDLQVTGVELDPAAGLAPPGARLVIGDFLDDAVLGARRFDAILCNPPYVRHHFLAPAYKTEVARRLGGRAGISLSRLAGTHVYFLLRALELLAPGGRAAFVTGAEWLQADYGAPLRGLLAASGWLRAVLVAAPEAGVFPGVLSTAAVVLVERSPGGAPRVALDLDAAALAALTARGGEGATVRALDGGRWTGAAAASGARLGDLFRVRRGVATGANDFFVLAPDDARRLRIPARHLRPCVAGPRDVTPRLLLSVEGAPGASLARYLAEGEARGLDRRYLCSARRPWYRVERVEPAPLLVAYMARGHVRVVRNRDGAVHLNLFHGIYPRPGSERLVARLARWLAAPAGQAAVRAAARRYASGLLKLEPRDLASVPLPPELTGRSPPPPPGRAARARRAAARPPRRGGAGRC